MEQLRDFELIVESLTFTVSDYTINHHVAPSVGNVHDPNVCMPGTTIHHKHIPVSLCLEVSFQRFVSLQV